MELNILRIRIHQFLKESQLKYLNQMLELQHEPPEVKDEKVPLEFLQKNLQKKLIIIKID